MQRSDLPKHSYHSSTTQRSPFAVQSFIHPSASPWRLLVDAAAWFAPGDAAVRRSHWLYPTVGPGHVSMGPGTYYESEIGPNSQLKVQNLRTGFCFAEIIAAGQSSVNEID